MIKIKLQNFLLAGVLAAASTAGATSIFKANNTSALNLPAAWTGGTVPGLADTAVWDATVTALNTTNVLGANTTWAGIRLLNPASPVQLNAGYNLTNGLGGIDLSQASQSLTLSNNIVVNVPQNWDVASGQTLALGGSLIKNVGGAVRFGFVEGSAFVTVTNAPNGLLQNGNVLFGTVNGADFAAVNGSGQIVSGNTLGIYTANPSGNFKSTVAVVDFSLASASGLNINGNSVVDGLRINQPNTAYAYWTVNIASGKVLSLNSLLITTNVGSQPVYVNGGGNLRIYNSGTYELLLFQNNPAAPVIVQNGTSITQNGAAASSIVKYGPGAVEIQSASFHTGGTKVYEGTLLISGAGTLGTSALNIYGGTFAGASGATNYAPETVWGGATNAIRINTAGGQFDQAANLSLAPGAHLLFTPTNGVSLSTTAAPLVITNAGTILAPTNSVFVDLAAIPAVGQYPLIKYAALGGAGLSAFTLNLPPHILGYLSNNTANSSIDLVVTADNQPLKWAAGSGVWDLATTANWKDASGAAATYQQIGALADPVIFEDSLSGTSPLTVTLNTSLTPSSVTVASAKNYTLTGNGGINGSGGLTKSGGGALTLATTNGFTGGLFLNGGIVNFSTGSNLGAGGISFAGGELQYAAGNQADISAVPVTFGAGGALIDDGGNTITWANPVGNKGSGGLTKVGAGTLTLSVANSYPGNTVISSGTLALAASAFITNSAAIVVGSGATLDASAGGGLVLGSAVNQLIAGNGIVNGGLTVPAGTVLSPATNGVVGTLSINNGSLTVNGGVLALDISNSAKDGITVTGNLNLTAGTVQLNVTGTLANGTYKLIQYSGSLSGGAASLAVTGFSQSGQIASLSDATVGEIDLVVKTQSGLAKLWQGGVNNGWDISTTANWLYGAGTSVYHEGDKVTFDDTAAQPYVSLLAAVNPASVIVSNNAQAYTFTDGASGSGKISGATGLTKSGSGTLILDTLNNYSGPTVINAGTVQVGDGGNTGDIGTGNITNNGALVFEQTDNRSVAGQISGTGDLTQQGSGTLTLGANNTYSGTTVISSGALQVGAGGTTGSLGSSSVTDNGTLILDRSGSVVLGNAISGSGSLVDIGGGTVTLAGNNSYAGGTGISNGVVKLGGAAALPAGPLYVDGTVDLSGFNATFTTLAGSTGVITNSGTTGTNVVTVGDDAANSSFAGVIADNSAGAKVALVKQGAATLQLNSASSYTGGTFVLGGTLTIGPAGVPGSAGILLTNGATLYLANAGTARPTVNNNVTIPAGSLATIGSGNLANAYNGNVLGTATSTNLINSSITLGQTAVKQFAGFPGTVVIGSLGTVRFSASGALTANGGDSTTLDLEGYLFTRSGGLLTFGALEGGGTVSSPSSGAQTLIIGGKGVDSTFAGTISTGTSLVKTGPGTLSFTGTLNHDGSTTVSNGVLALASDSASLDASPTVVLAANTAVIDVSGRTDDTLWLGNSIGQTLSGIGTIRGNLSQGANSTVNVGLGILNVTNTATLNGPVNLVLNRTNGVNASEIVAGSFIVNNTATLTVTNVGPALAGGEVFHLFSQPVNGFGSITLPTITSPLAWSNRLAVDGTLAVLGSLVNTNVTALTNSFDGHNLTLNWPADHIGWHLQSQTNSLASGLGTNWVNVSGAETTNRVILPVNPVNGAVFFRLTYP